jgi:hypothetical protein
MSRLLFAAARGAKIQTKWVDSGDSWQTTGQLVLVDTMRYYRIHPDDEHLAYGPISTVLREVALTGDCEDSDIPYVRVEFERVDGYWSSTEEQRRVFCLILAECLADSGL